MSYETLVYNRAAFGSNYSGGVFTPSTDVTSTNWVVRNDTESDMNVGDTVNIYDDDNGNLIYSNATYVGYFQFGSAQRPFVQLNNGDYALFGRPGFGTYNITAADFTQGSVVCFAAGTLIRTVHGEIEVGNLQVGDIVVTASGAQRPIVWIGSRNLDAGTRPLPEPQQPVRIRANAFGSSLPASDLLVSSQHAIVVGPEHGAMGEALVPAAALINGATIIREPVASVTYWHVELDAHDILIANGQPAESYLAVGNRGFFADADGLGDPSPDAPSSCLPRTDDPEKLRPVRAWLRAQAEALGWQIKTTDLFAGLRLVADGAVFMPETRGLSARVLVPAGAQEVWLVSGASVPWEVSDAGDARRLGLCVSGLSVSDGWGASMSLALDDPELTDGWHVTEAHGEGALRWTDGRARLPASLWDGSTAVFLRIDLVRPSLPAWCAPAELLAASAETGGHLRPVFA